VRPVVAASAAVMPTGSGRQQPGCVLGMKIELDGGSGSCYDAAYSSGSRRQQQGYSVNMAGMGAYGELPYYR
jgi:hypothetical protein